jgi:hypothetical protein
MPFQLPPRLSSVLVSVLAAGVMLTVASCSHLTPLGPDSAATMPQPHHLRSPLILQDIRAQSSAPADGCPAGYVTNSGNPGPCYGPKTGPPVTITSAGVSSVFSFRPPTPPGQQQAAPVQYGFWITLPADDAPALTAVIPAPSGPPGPPTARAVTSAAIIPTISVAGRTWVLAGFATRFTDRELEVVLPSRNQALQLQRILAASG